MNPVKLLTALGVPEQCIERRSSCEEKSRRFRIVPQKGEEIWRVKVDNCWIQQEEKKIDYLFWGKSQSGKKLILLVELKGGHYGNALEQIHNTLQLLCKYSRTNIVHNNQAVSASLHSAVSEQGVQAYVVLSTGKQASKRASKRGRKIPQRLRQLEQIRQRFNVRVCPTTDQFSIRGVDAFFRN